MRCRALEAHHALSLGVTVGHVVRVVADVFLSSVGQALVARGLIGHTMGALTVQWLQSQLNTGSAHLEERGLTALSYGVEAELVETAGGGDGGVVVDPLAAVHRPVVVAVVVDGAVAVKHQAVLTGLFRQCSWEEIIIIMTLL